MIYATRFPLPFNASFSARAANNFVVLLSQQKSEHQIENYFP
jgi:hypothetical protein